MQNLHQLNESFAMEGVLAFDEPHPGMPRVRISTPACSAELYLQGAHLTGWQPAGQQPVLFLSERSAFQPGKAIRGGIPIVFPWFGAADRSPVHPPPNLPAHGYARTSPWTLRFAALAGDDLHLSLTLDRDEHLQTPPFDALQLGLEVSVGSSLSVRLTVVNTGDKPLQIEEALHTYLHVGNVMEAAVEGLQGTEYLDKTDDFRRKRQEGEAIRFGVEVDRPYLHTGSPLTLLDPGLRRRLVITKEGSETTVVWNPAAEGDAKLPDLLPDDWQRFVCVETANAAEDMRTLAPREAHTMGMRFHVESL